MPNPFEDAIVIALPSMFSAVGAVDGTYTDSDTTAAVSVLLDFGVTEYPGVTESQPTQAYDKISIQRSEVDAPHTRGVVTVGDDEYRLDKQIMRDQWVSEFVILKTG